VAAQPLSLSLRLTTWAATRRFNLPYPVPDPELPKEVLIAISIGLLLVGATLPAWGPRVGVPAMCNWATRYLACRRLYALWRDLCARSTWLSWLAR
jgi:hypothetical protein